MHFGKHSRSCKCASVISHEVLDIRLCGYTGKMDSVFVICILPSFSSFRSTDPLYALWHTTKCVCVCVCAHEFIP